jgi:hypothetical protein
LGPIPNPQSPIPNPQSQSNITFIYPNIKQSKISQILTNYFNN